MRIPGARKGPAARVAAARGTSLVVGATSSKASPAWRAVGCRAAPASRVPRGWVVVNRVRATRVINARDVPAAGAAAVAVIQDARLHGLAVRRGAPTARAVSLVAVLRDARLDGLAADRGAPAAWAASLRAVLHDARLGGLTADRGAPPASGGRAIALVVVLAGPATRRVSHRRPPTTCPATVADVVRRAATTLRLRWAAHIAPTPWIPARDIVVGDATAHASTRGVGRWIVPTRLASIAGRRSTLKAG